MRRGADAAHIVYGVAATINSAVYVVVLSAGLVQQLGAEAAAVWRQEMEALHLGQGMDIDWREKGKCPTEQEYLWMVVQSAGSLVGAQHVLIFTETGGLFRLVMRLLQTQATVNKRLDMSRLAGLLGQLFQVRDDYLNLTSTSLGKSFCDDLTEGKFSLPVIHSVRSTPENSWLVDALREGRENGMSDERKKEILAWIESTGSFEYTVRVLERLAEDTRNEVERIVAVTGRKSEALQGILGLLRKY